MPFEVPFVPLMMRDSEVHWMPARPASTVAEAGAVDDDGDVQKLYDNFHTDD